MPKVFINEYEWAVLEPVKIGTDLVALAASSYPDLLVEIPAELLTRHEAAVAEFLAVQELLEELRP